MDKVIQEYNMSFIFFTILLEIFLHLITAQKVMFMMHAETQKGNPVK
jgi:hypothetical protein